MDGGTECEHVHLQLWYDGRDGGNERAACKIRRSDMDRQSRPKIFFWRKRRRLLAQLGPDERPLADRALGCLVMMRNLG